MITDADFLIARQLLVCTLYFGFISDYIYSVFNKTRHFSNHIHCKKRDVKTGSGHHLVVFQ